MDLRLSNNHSYMINKEEQTLSNKFTLICYQVTKYLRVNWLSSFNVKLTHSLGGKECQISLE